MRADPALVAAYVAEKRRIGGGITGGPQYAEAKGAFFASVNGMTGVEDTGSPCVGRES